MSKQLKVGDRVKVIKCSLSDCSQVNHEFTIKSNYNGNKDDWYFSEGGHGHNYNELELVEEEPKLEPCVKPYTRFTSYKVGVDLACGGGSNAYVYPWKEFNNKQKTIMSKITTFAKNLVLSADEKMLRKHNLKTECGEYTEEAQTIIMNKLCKENEVYLVNMCADLEEEEAKK